MNHSQIVSFLWGVADLIRDTFKRSKARYQGKIENLDPQLRRASGYAFYNTSRYDFQKVLQDAPHLAQNLRN